MTFATFDLQRFDQQGSEHLHARLVTVANYQLINTIIGYTGYCQYSNVLLLCNLLYTFYRQLVSRFNGFGPLSGK